MNPLTEGRSLIMILNDFVLIMKDFYGRSPYKIGVNRYITPIKKCQKVNNSLKITLLTLFKGLFATCTNSSTLESIFKNLFVDSVAVDINSTVAKKALFARKSLLFRPFPFFAQNAFHSVTNDVNFLTLSAGTLHTFGQDPTHPRPRSLDKEGKWKTTVCSHR